MAKPPEASEQIKSKLGVEQAKTVVNYIDTNAKQGLATNDDIHRLKLKIEGRKVS